MKHFFGILPLDVKIGSDTTYYHFNCGPLYLAGGYGGHGDLCFSGSAWHSVTVMGADDAEARWCQWIVLKLCGGDHS